MPIIVPGSAAPQSGGFPAGFTLVVNRYGDNDRYGRRPTPTTHFVDGCASAPGGSEERTGDSLATLERDTIYAPSGADILDTDELVVPDGQPLIAGTYQVNGKPTRWSSPFTGHAFGMVVQVTRTS